MSDAENEEPLRKDAWLSLTADVIAEHPDWVGDTVMAVQTGVREAQERQMDRIEDLSMGLWQAVSTRPGAKRRDGETIAKAIETSTLAGSPWAQKAIEKERKNP